MELFILILAFVVTLFCLYCRKVYRYWKDRGVPQTRPYWVVGDGRSLLGIEHISVTIQRFWDEHPDAKYSGFYSFWKPQLIIKDPDLIKKITVKNFEHFVDHIQFFDVDNEKIWSRNVFALEGQKWKDTRLMLTPTFTGSKMKAMLGLISKCSQNFVQHFLDKKEDIVEIDLHNSMNRFTNDAIATTAFGLEVDSFKNPDNEFYSAGQKVLQFRFFNIIKLLLLKITPSFSKFIKIQFFPADVINFFTNLVKEIMRVREEKEIVRPDVINILMESKKEQEKNGNKSFELTDDDIVSHAFLFFLGGLDTVSSGLTCLLYELMVHPDIQDKLRQEILETKNRLDGEKLTYDVLTGMKYFDMVLSESLRKWPPMAMINRKCTKPYVLEPPYPGGQPVLIEKGTNMIIPTTNLHHNPKLFPNPEKFDPERFNEDNKKDINPYAYAPFGCGPRNCIGMRFSLMEIKTFVYYLLAEFQIVPTGKTVIPMKLLEVSFSPKPKGKMTVGLKKIQK